MAYIVLMRPRTKQSTTYGWLIDPGINNHEHGAISRQRNIERIKPDYETARVYIELPQ